MVVPGRKRPPCGPEGDEIDGGGGESAGDAMTGAAMVGASAGDAGPAAAALVGASAGDAGSTGAALVGASALPAPDESPDSPTLVGNELTSPSEAPHAEQNALPSEDRSPQLGQNGMRGTITQTRATFHWVGAMVARRSGGEPGTE